MKQRGRVSTESYEIATIANHELDRTERQKPPPELTEAECEVWAAVVNSQPAEHFSPAVVPLLAQYCRHTVQARNLAHWIENALSAKDEDGGPAISVRDYERLLKMQALESQSIARIGTKLRITNQSIMDKYGKPNSAIKGAIKRPWEG